MSGHSFATPKQPPACAISASQSMLYAKDLARLYSIEKERAEDLRAGARVQNRFLTPAEETGRLLNGAGYSAAIVNKAPCSISGDFYFPRPLGGGAVGLLLADSCGHGLPAALLSMRVASFLQGSAGQAGTPRAFLQRVNSDIHGLDLHGAFVAGIYLVLHATGCSIANAGQPYPLLLRNGRVQELPLSGAPLGLAADSDFRQQALRLGEGDRLVLHTDGIVEAERADGECFGSARLIQSLQRLATASLQQVAQGVMADLEAFLQGAPQEDDHTLIILEKRGADIDSQQPCHWTNKLCLNSEEEQRDALYEQFLKDAEPLWPNQADVDLLLLSLVEAVNNAVEHGNRFSADACASVRYLLANQFCLAVVTDQGQGFEPAAIDLRSATGGRGRGLALIRENSDVFFFNRQGNTCVICKGVKNMDMQSSYVTAKVAPLHGGSVLITDLDFGAKKMNIANGLSEIFESVSAHDQRSAFIDLKRVRLISSMGWGAIFAQAEMAGVKRIVLFNASEAVLRSAEQMGLPRNEGPYAKISVFSDCSEAMDLLAAELCHSLNTASA